MSAHDRKVVFVMPTFSSPEPYVSLSVAAEHFSVCEKTLRRMISRQEIPARRLGRGPRAAIRLKISEVEAAMYPMGSATK